MITSDTVRRDLPTLAGGAETSGDFVRTSSSAPRGRFPSRRMNGSDGVLTFGDADDAPAVTVTTRDVRCVMVNLDPDGGSPSPEVLKTVVRANENNAGIYATVTRIGRLAVGQTVVLHR